MSDATRTSRALAASALVAALAGCPMGLRSSNDPANVAARCAQGIDLFEQSRCTNIAPVPANAPSVGVEFHQLDADCQDAASQQRLRALESTCVAGYDRSVADRRAAHDDVRARYHDQVAALQGDPAYRPLLDRWIAARDDAQIAEAEFADKGRHDTTSPYYRVFEAKRAKLDEESAAMRALLVKHGIDPKDAQVLGVW